MSTAAQPKSKKTTTSKKAPSHPPFVEMITDAIVSLKERTGSSQYAINKFIEEKHKGLPPTFRKLLLHYLKKSVAAGKLVKVKNSFKLPPTRSPPPAKAVPASAPAPKKPKAVAKSVTKPSVKAGSKTKAKTGPKQKAVAKPKAKTVAASAKPKAKPAKVVGRTAGKKVAAKPARKTLVKVVKKPRSVKSPAKKAPAKKAKK